MDAPLSPDQQNQIDALLFGRQKLQAIKLYRDWTHAGLKEAKDAVDGREAELEKQSPQSFSGKSTGCFSILLLAASGLTVAAWVGVRVLS